MDVGIHEAIAIYAKACRAWYGPKAESVARKRAAALRRRGDPAGGEVWDMLADALKDEQQYRSAA